jgi:hypothetical protein
MENIVKTEIKAIKPTNLPTKMLANKIQKQNKFLKSSSMSCAVQAPTGLAKGLV